MDKINTDLLNTFIAKGLEEDVRDGDHTSLACIAPESRTRARLLVKDDGVIAGVRLAAMILQAVDDANSIVFYKNDGDTVAKGDIVFEVSCNTQALLRAERLLLNAMQRMSGIATMSREYVNEVADFQTVVLDTRKTTPLLRMLEKWAVRIGGATNYRDGLYDRFMLKDNHIDACGSIAAAVARVHTYRTAKGLELPITLEVRNFDELEQALFTGGIDRIMLDNFSTADLALAVQRINRRYETEASGGITLDTLREKAATGVDFISVGALTHSVKSLDLSLKVVK